MSIKQPPVYTAGSQETTPPKRRRTIQIVGTVIAVLVVASGVFWGIQHAVKTPAAATPPRVAPGNSATPSPTAVPRVLYQADWSHGADGWTLPAGASIVNGSLVIDGVSGAPVAVPYVPPTTHYAVEMDIEVQAVHVGTPGGAKGGIYGLVANDSSGTNEYSAQMLCLRPGADCVGEVYEITHNGKYPNGMYTFDYVMGSGVQSYRVEATDTTLTFCPNDCLKPIISPAPMTTPHLMLVDHNVQIVVSRFVITTL